MSFKHEVLQQAWYRSGAQCECTLRDHGHPGRCTRQMLHPKQGEETPGGWEAKKRDEAKAADPENTLCLCWPCYAHGKTPAQKADAGMKRK